MEIEPYKRLVISYLLLVMPEKLITYISKAKKFFRPKTNK